MSEQKMFVSIRATQQEVQFLVLIACRNQRCGSEIHQSFCFSSL